MSKKDDGRTKIGDDDTNGTIDLETLKRAREMMAFDETAFEEHDEPEGSVSKQPCLPKYAPIKLFATNTDKQKRSSCPLRQEHCMTLREMMGFDPQPSSAINWIMLTSYLIDFDYLLDEIPELLSVPKVVIFYGHGSPTSTWKKACTRPDGTCSVEFRQLNPSDPPNSASNPLGSRIHYGVHHTKMVLMGFADHTLRVIIHTTNIRRPDLELKTNAAYLESFPLKIKSNCSPKPCEFEADLLAYLESYKYNTLHQWSSDDTTPSQKLTKELGRYDFSKAQVVLIPSTPGWYSYNSRPKGYLKLSEAIRARVAKRDVSTPIVAEFSSIGSLHKKWLQEFYQSLDCAQNDCKDLSKLKVVYPTVEEIRLSVEGYAGGQSVPGNTKNVEKAVVKPLYHKWASTEDHPLHKPSNVPHIKTYYQLTHEDDGQQSMEWFCLTSHNLSKAAWGEKQNTKFGQKLFMRHWELGVVVFPPKGGTLGPVPACGSSNSLAVSIPLPFQLKPSRYDISDQPWAVDKHYQKADGFGRTDCRG